MTTLLYICLASQFIKETKLLTITVHSGKLYNKHSTNQMFEEGRE
jgi:hypothetical protein